MENSISLFIQKISFVKLIKSLELFLTLAFLVQSLESNAQRNVATGSNMESAANWTVYNMGSATPATVQFNYTASKPNLGSGGCLRVTASQAMSVLVWQKITVKSGETYTVNAAIKTNNIASAWAEIYVSAVAPVEDKEYLPSDNTDVISGFSTWSNCGPNVNGSFVNNACTGKKSFVAPGTIGQNVDIYFGFKTGSLANPLPNSFEVLLDDLQLLTRNLDTGNEVLSTCLGSAGTDNVTVSAGVMAAQFLSSLVLSPHAKAELLTGGGKVTNNTVLDNTMQLRITAESGTVKNYSVVLVKSLLATETISNIKTSVTQYACKQYVFKGKVEASITDKENPIKGSMLDLQSEDIWLQFPAIKPSEVNAKYLPQILINGAPAVLDQNIRLAQYAEGTMLISHPKTYKPLKLYNGNNQSGNMQEFGINTFYRPAELGAMNNQAKSILLKKGYMATLAENEDGTGKSQVYIAYQEDIVINQLPTGLYNTVSFVKVVPWRWVTKKGWTNGTDAAQTLNCTWNYDWNNEGNSTLDNEYVPMRHNLNWNNYANINNKINSTHALGFNEPDRSDQANISVAQAINAWPEMLKSGLRLGSPSPSDASAGLTWLYDFMDQADARGYRVDFVTVHWYKGGQTAQQFYSWLKGVHERTGRPIWITEWNNGANWTCCKPTYAQQAQSIKEMTNMLDTCSFVERYSLYEWVEDTRQMFFASPLALTPAGKVYQSNSSPMAYNPAKIKEVITFLDTEIETDIALQFYPNPVSNVLHIAANADIYQASIFSVNGEKIAELRLEDGSIDLSPLQPGIYLIQFTDGQGVWTRKLVKEE